MAEKFLEYRPWSKALWNVVRRNVWSGKFFMLDVQLGSECNAHCWHCDSSCSARQEPADLDIKAVTRLVKQMSHEYNFMYHAAADPSWLQGFICGLGEPTTGKNLEKLKELIEATSEYMSWALFNNGVDWDDDLTKYLKDGKLAVQVQCNGDDVKDIMGRMGISEAAAERQIKNRKMLYQLANDQHRLSDGGIFTMVCASIVPDRRNYSRLFGWTEEAVEMNVFPLIAELEEAGRCVGKAYEDNKTTDVALSDLKYRIWRHLRHDYKVPYCPAAIGAIHVNNRNQVTVDARTGLGCGWFSMDASSQTVLGDIRKDSLEVLARNILEYRKSRIEPLRGLIYNYPHMVFGGCGGNARYLLQDYIASYDEAVAAGIIGNVGRIGM